MNHQPDEDEPITAAAAQWHMASGEMAGGDMDWDGFTRWLEADPRHARAYDEIALTDTLVTDMVAGQHRHTRTYNDNAAAAPSKRRLAWRAGAGGAVAAVVLAMVAIPAMRSTPETSYATADAPRAIALADGSVVTLAPHSQLTVSGPDAMRLTGGAWFDVRHIAGRQMAITAGAVTIRDIGTRFDVQAGDEKAGSVRIAVADGAVEVASQGMRPIALGQGHAVLFDGARHQARTSTMDPTDIGGWRQGRLSYENMPLALVAADLDRYAGGHLGVPPAWRDRRFSGTLIIGKPQDAPRDLAQLMGLALVRRHDGAGPDGWWLEPGRGAATH